MTAHTNDFRALPVGWYVHYNGTNDEVDGTPWLVPCPGLVRNQDAWEPATYVDGYLGVDANGALVYRPDLAHLPGDLEVRVVDGVEYVRQSVPTTRRVLGPDTPFPASKEGR